MTVPSAGRHVSARELPDLTRDPGPFTAFERHLVGEITRERFHAEPDATPERFEPSVWVLWTLLAAAVLILVLGFLLGATTGQGLS